MRKIYSVLAAVCLLSACSGGENATLTETTASEASAENETTAAAETTTVTETTTAADTTTITETTTAEFTTSVPLDYTLSYAERSVSASEEQDKLYEFFSENSDDAELCKSIDDSRVQLSETDGAVLPENYEIDSEEFFADFDGDGNGELYVCRYSALFPQSPWGVYQELWYTDGEVCVPVDNSSGRGLFGGILEPQDGIPLLYNVPEITMGAPFQPADVYFIKDGKPTLYELPEDKCFLYDGGKVFIAPNVDDESEYNNFFDELNNFIDEHNETLDDPDSFQKIGWVDGELKIISGFGAENT